MTTEENYDFQRAIKPMYLVGRLLGVTHYSVSGLPWQRKYTVSKTDIILTIVHIVLVFTATRLQTERLLTFTQNTSFVKKALSLLMGFFPAIITWSNMFCFYLRKDKYFEVMYKFSEVQEKLKVFNVNSLRSTRRFVYQTLFCAYFMFGVSSFLYLYIQVTSNSPILYPVLLCSMYTIQLALKCEIFVFLNELRLQFRNVRVCFENIHEEINNVKKLYYEQDITSKLKLLGNLYSAIYGIGKDIDTIFSVQVQIKLATSFMSTCSTLFHLPIVYEIVKPLSFVNVLMWLALNILEVFVMLLMFSLVKLEVNKCVISES